MAVIAVDIDCTLSDFAHVWMDWLNNKYGFYVKYKELTNYDMTKNFPTLDPEQVYGAFYDKRFWDGVRPVENSQTVMKYLNTQHDVYILSATSPEHVVFKADWLHKYFPFIPESRYIFTKAKDLVKCDVLIDDCPANLVRDDCYTIQIKQPWQDRKWADYEVDNWKDVIDILEGKD